jgi:hypothetical protein
MCRSLLKERSLIVYFRVYCWFSLLHLTPSRNFVKTREKRAFYNDFAVINQGVDKYYFHLINLVSDSPRIFTHLLS